MESMNKRRGCDTESATLKGIVSRKQDQQVDEQICKSSANYHSSKNCANDHSFSMAQMTLKMVDIGLDVVEQVITMTDRPEENTITNGIKTIQTTKEDRQCREVEEQLY